MIYCSIQDFLNLNCSKLHPTITNTTHTHTRFSHVLIAPSKRAPRKNGRENGPGTRRSGQIFHMWRRICKHAMLRGWTTAVRMEPFGTLPPVESGIPGGFWLLLAPLVVVVLGRFWVWELVVIKVCVTHGLYLAWSLGRLSVWGILHLFRCAMVTYSKGLPFIDHIWSVHCTLHSVFAGPKKIELSMLSAWISKLHQKVVVFLNVGVE